MIQIGDYVRVLSSQHRNTDYVGRVGEVTGYHEDGLSEAYEVYFGGHLSGFEWFAEDELEEVDV